MVHAFSCVCVGVHLRVSPSSLWIRLTRPTPLGRPDPTQPSGARDTVVPPTGRRNMVALGQQGHQGLDPGTKIAGRQGVRQTCVQSTGAEQEGQQLKTNGDKGQQQPNVKNEGAQGAIDERHQQRRAKAITREAAPQLCGLAAVRIISINDIINRRLATDGRSTPSDQQQGAGLMTSSRKRNLTSK